MGGTVGGLSANPATGDVLGIGAHASGTRLKARLMATADGARELFDFIDTGRGNEPCRFVPDSSGTYRCEPESVQRQQPYFQDAACTKPLFPAASDGCSAPKYVSTYAASCGLAVPTFASFTKITSSKLVKKGSAVFLLNNTTCSAYTADRDLFEIVTEEAVDPASLVGASIRVGGQAPLQTRTLVGDDGASAFLDWYDPNLDAPCRLQQTGDLTQPRCAPETLGEEPGALGELCSGPAGPFASPDSCAPNVAYSAQTRGSNCSPAIHRLGSPTCGAISNGEPGPSAKCTPIIVMPATEDVTAQTFEMKAFGRLRPTAVMGTNSDLAHDPHVPVRALWIDDTLSTTCSFQTLPDDTIRCVPTPYASLYFTESTCTTVGEVHLTGTSSSCRGLPDRAGTWWDATSCPAVVSVFQSGSASPADAPVWVLRDGTCVSEGTTTVAATAIPVAPDMLVSATITME